MAAALALALALASSIIFGIADFWAGLASRRSGALPVAIGAQLVGFVGILIVVLPPATTGLSPLLSRGLSMGLGAGLLGAGSSGFFYQAMRQGLISIASPIMSCGAVIAFALSITDGERPSPIAAAGAAIALTGAVIISRPSLHIPPENRGGIKFAILAGVATGCYLFLLGKASNVAGGVVAVAGARVGTLVMLGCVAVVVRPTVNANRRFFEAIAAIGLMNVTALVMSEQQQTLG